MKKLIRSSTTVQAAKKYDEYLNYTRGRTKFRIHISRNHEPDFEAQISEIHPYDEAEYAWAQIDANKLVKFFKEGKLIDKVQMHYYEDEDHEDVDEYIDDIIDQVCVGLRDINVGVEPRMMHN